VQNSPGTPPPMTEVPYYPDALWDQQWKAWMVLQDFATTKWKNFTPSSKAAIPNDPTDEINDLIKLALDERPDAMGEILGQADEFLTYFAGALGITTNGFSATRRLLHIGLLVGTFTVMYFKEKYRRVRPSQLCPALLPPLSIPGHASYPSGHSTQSHLISLCVQLALPSGSTATILGSAVDTLAKRITRNRQIAGLHYQSDSDAGEELAKYAYNLLRTAMPPAPGYKKKSRFDLTVEEAQKEWK
jgi:hypothetical protein